MEGGRPWSGRFRFALYIAALAALGAVLVWPPTHRIAREQIAFVLPAAPTAMEPVRRMVGGEIKPAVLTRLAAFAAEHPDDDAMQTALATLGPPQPGENPMRAKVRHLAPLLDRYPRGVVVRSAVLRYTMGFAHEFTGATAAEWAIFDRAATEGERLDPDNAFFPLMSAQRLDAGGRKSEATQALLRAGRCARWREYIREELEGMWRLEERGDPWPDGLGRTASAAAMVFPQYGGLHRLAKSQAAVAMSLERSNRILDGLAIRHALMRVGALMRSQATVAIGNLVGETMTNRAAGRQSEVKPSGLSVSARREIYQRYLISTGHREEAAYAQAEFVAGDRVRSVFRSGANSNTLTNLVAYCRLWLFALVILCGAAFTLLSGAIAAFLARLGWTSEERRIGIWKRIAAVPVSATAMLVPAIWMAVRLREPARWTQDTFSRHTNLEPLMPFGFLALLAVPIVLKLALINSAFIEGRPLTQAVIRGFQRFAAPLAAAMLIGYGAVLIDLAKRDQAMAVTATERAQHEGRYIAHRAGIAWPK